MEQKSPNAPLPTYCQLRAAALFRPKRAISLRYHLNHYKMKTLIGLHGTKGLHADVAEEFATTPRTVQYWIQKVIYFEISMHSQRTNL
jgi:hypothetical protein